MPKIINIDIGKKILEDVHEDFKSLLVRNNRDLFGKMIEELNKNIYNIKLLCPPPELIFNAFKKTNPNIRVIIIGQDPYPNINDACGYAFAVPNGRKIPSSLNN